MMYPADRKKLIDYASASLTLDGFIEALKARRDFLKGEIDKAVEYKKELDRLDMLLWQADD